jgi:hypothetical protein
MFNDLNSQQNGHQQIDDIFAETDKTASNSNAGIETHRVGLTTNTAVAADPSAPLTFSEEPKAAKPMWLKIVPIVIIVSILVLSGYLVYSKYFTPSQNSNAVVEKNPVKNVATTTENANVNANGTMTPSSAVSTTTGSGSNNPTYVSELPGLATTTPGQSDTITPAIPAPTIDTDNDGLTDEEEKVYGTNPAALDTDADGLSDYEEIKIYKTNPLLPDTDGDSYLDGAEVKNGYNPNGAGKLPGVESPAATK